MTPFEEGFYAALYASNPYTEGSAEYLWWADGHEYRVDGPAVVPESAIGSDNIPLEELTGEERLVLNTSSTVSIEDLKTYVNT